MWLMNNRNENVLLLSLKNDTTPKLGGLRGCDVGNTVGFVSTVLLPGPKSLG